MEIEVVPEPSPEEREAILAALAAADDGSEPAAYRSVWRRAALDPGEDDEGL